MSGYSSCTRLLLTVVHRRKYESTDDDALEDGHEVLDVNEGILAAVYLERLQSFHDKLSEVLPPLLAVIDTVAKVVWTA